MPTSALPVPSRKAARETPYILLQRFEKQYRSQLGDTDGDTAAAEGSPVAGRLGKSRIMAVTFAHRRTSYFPESFKHCPRAVPRCIIYTSQEKNAIGNVKKAHERFFAARATVRGDITVL